MNGKVETREEENLKEHNYKESLSKIMNNGETQESLHCNKQPKASQTSNCK